MRVVLIIAMLLTSLVGFVWTQQRRLIYFPFGAVPDPAAIGLERATPVSFPTADGLTLSGWFLTPVATPDFTVLVFNGNAGNRAFRAPLADALVRANLAVLLFDYRGFGGNPGAPTEEGLRHDARAARDYVIGRAGVHRDRLVYFGESLGTAVVVELAAAHPPAAMVLRSPFTSMTDVGRHHYPSLPGWLLRDRFDTINRIARVRAPVMVIGGDADSIVPIAQTLRVFEAAGDPKRLLVIEGADHNDGSLLNGREMIDSVLRFLRDRSQARNG
ncbi:MAG TPA: alpha/beta hydrolase [Vicinamibacterales bacterium]|nr:alpha/beta hydrolase [Vicinamibacterales bacterium]